jgi:hypothetical protein
MRITSVRKRKNTPPNSRRIGTTGSGGIKSSALALLFFLAGALLVFAGFFVVVFLCAMDQ